MKKTHTLGDAPIEPELIEIMNALAHGLQDAFNGKDCPITQSKVGFVLLSFNIGDTGRANYISNCNRDDIVVLLKEQLARFEGMPKQKGHA